MIHLDEERLRAVLRDLRGSTGEVLRSLGTLRMEDLSESLSEDLVSQATRHAGHLERALGSLLDLTDLGGGDFSLDLQEVDLHRLVRQRSDLLHPILESLSLAVPRREIRHDDDPLHPLIADPIRVARMIDLGLQVCTAWVRPQGEIEVCSEHSRFTLRFPLDGEISDWHEAWWKGTVKLTEAALDELLDSLRGPGRAYRRDSVQSLQLMHGIAGRHGGSFSKKTDGGQTALQAEFPIIAPEEALPLALGSRLVQTPTGVGSLAVVVLRVPGGTDLESYGRAICTALLRTSDSIFPSPREPGLVLLVNDCAPDDVPHFLSRVSECAGDPSAVGAACCPADASEPEALIALAHQRLHPSGERRPSQR